MGLLMEGMALATSVGLGCGTCCGTTIHASLYGYLMTHVKDMKEALCAYARFLLGKVASVVLLCTLASLLGKSLLDEEGRIFGVPLAVPVDVFLILLGGWLLFQWIKERKRQKTHNCQNCPGHHPTDHTSTRPIHGALFGMGLGYGFSPCAPLLLICGYSATLPPAHAALLGLTFALVSTLSPGLLFLAAAGALAKKMREEIGLHLSWLRLGTYILFISLSLIHLIKEVEV